VGELLGDRIGLVLEAELPEQVVDLSLDCLVLVGEGERARRLALPGEQRRPDVLPDGHLLEQLDDLEAPDEPAADPLVGRQRRRRG